MSIYDFSLQTIDGEETSLAPYRGQIMLLVNVASKCGLTPQYTGLQTIYERLGPKGLVVLGFPCNQFAAQEPGTNEEIKTFCTTKFNVTFPMFSKIDVNGDNRHPLYAYLTGLETQPDGSGDIVWNFAKFLVGRDGRVLARFEPRVSPEDLAFLQIIQHAIA